MKTYNNPALRAELGYRLDISEYRKRTRRARTLVRVASALGIVIAISVVAFLFAILPLVLEYEQSLGY